MHVELQEVFCFSVTLESSCWLTWWLECSLFHAISEIVRTVFSGLFREFTEPVLNCNREPFWEELGVVRGLWERPWCVGGTLIQFVSRPQ